MLLFTSLLGSATRHLTMWPGRLPILGRGLLLILGRFSGLVSCRGFVAAGCSRPVSFLGRFLFAGGLFHCRCFCFFLCHICFSFVNHRVIAVKLLNGWPNQSVQQMASAAIADLCGSVDCVLRLGLLRLQCSIPCSEILEFPNPGQHLVQRVTMHAQSPRIRANSPEPPPAFRPVFGWSMLHYCVVYNIAVLSPQEDLSFIFQRIQVMLLA
jgi:hypothetical protein